MVTHIFFFITYKILIYSRDIFEKSVLEAKRNIKINIQISVR